MTYDSLIAALGPFVKKGEGEGQRGEESAAEKRQRLDARRASSCVGQMPNVAACAATRKIRGCLSSTTGAG